MSAVKSWNDKEYVKMEAMTCMLIPSISALMPHAATAMVSCYKNKPNTDGSIGNTARCDSGRDNDKWDGPMTYQISKSNNIIVALLLNGKVVFCNQRLLLVRGARYDDAVGTAVESEISMSSGTVLLAFNG